MNQEKDIDTPIITNGLSVVLPTFNGADWLPKTIEYITHALKAAKVNYCEIVVVNDGSTDETIEVIKKIKMESDVSVRLVNQLNSGRFVARRTGTNAAKYPNILFVDTRVFIGRKSLNYIVQQQAKDNTRRVWCSHVKVDKKGNIYARFWDAVVYIAWRKYFSNPRDIAYGIDQFDSYPKGTTCFFATKQIMIDANDWFEKNTKDLKTSNDDTLLLRYIARNNSINIAPGFWCIYHARSSLKQYTKHVFHRGKVFVDGFLRNDGNKLFIPLLAYLIISFSLAIFLLFNIEYVIPVFILVSLLWFVELGVLLISRMPVSDALSLFILTPIFTLFYGAGIWVQFARIYFFKR